MNWSANYCLFVLIPKTVSIFRRWEKQLSLKKKEMSTAPKKNSFLDIYVQSIQKDNAFFKEKVSSLQKELEDVKARSSEERKGFQQELSALKEDLSRMVNDVANLRSQNGSLTEKLEEYEASYVPGSGSKKLKDALGDYIRKKTKRNPMILPIIMEV